MELPGVGSLVELSGLTVAEFLDGVLAPVVEGSLTGISVSMVMESGLIRIITRLPSLFLALTRKELGTISTSVKPALLNFWRSSCGILCLV